jgi:tol-pal system protein YbgF
MARHVRAGCTLLKSPEQEYTQATLMPRAPVHALALAFAACAFIASLLVGCGSSRPKPPPPGDPSLPEIDVLQLKENSEEALRLSQENRLELQSLNAKAKELESRLSQVTESLSNLPLDRLDSLDRRVDALRIDMATLDARITRIPNAPPPVKLLATFRPNAAGGSSASPETATVTPASDPVQAGETGAKTKATATKPSAGKPATTQPGKPSASEGSAYKQAFDQFYAGQYGAARKSFQALLERFPKGAYADNSQYWVGECEFALGRHKEALAAFSKVLDFTESEKADDAQLKLGYTHLKLGDKKTAEEAFRKLLSLYPDSEYLERAKDELAKLR